MQKKGSIESDVGIRPMEKEVGPEGIECLEWFWFKENPIIGKSVANNGKSF
jgi:hypothetical protein